VEALTFEQARACVLEAVRPLPGEECLPLAEAAGRVLSRDMLADRDQPALARSVRDGYALRAADLPGTLTCIGEIRAGEQWTGSLGKGQTLAIMTGAPVPSGADAVAMVEHCRVDGNQVTPTKPVAAGDFIDPAGSMCRAGDVVLRRGQRLDYAGLGVLASIGAQTAPVFPRPKVAIIATGDELVELHERPAPHQVRNSNRHSLEAQVTRAGGLANVLPIARDSLDATRSLIEKGLQADLLLLSGGVSAGKYDVVEHALKELGAEFYFDRILIQPGQPLVFGRCRGKFFFGLPGNPSSTMVCFEVFARAALEKLAGETEPMLPLLESVLAEEVRVRPGLTRFLPARLSADGKSIRQVPWQGSGDIAALARGNCFLVTEPDHDHYAAGERIRVLLR